MSLYLDQVKRFESCEAARRSRKQITMTVPPVVSHHLFDNYLKPEFESKGTLAPVDSLSICKEDSVRFAPGPKCRFLRIRIQTSPDLSCRLCAVQICPKLLSLDRYFLFLDTSHSA